MNPPLTIPDTPPSLENTPDLESFQRKHLRPLGDLSAFVVEDLPILVEGSTSSRVIDVLSRHVVRELSTKVLATRIMHEYSFPYDFGCVKMLYQSTCNCTFPGSLSTVAETEVGIAS